MAGDEVATVAEVALLCGVRDECEGSVIRLDRLDTTAESFEKVGASGVKEVIAVEVELLDDRQRGGGSPELGQRDGAIERDDGAGHAGEIA